MRRRMLATTGDSLIAVLIALALPYTTLAAPPFAYVVDLTNTVTVINTLTHEVTGSIDPPISAGLVGVAISPDGSRLYLADGNHTINVVDSPADNPTFSAIHLDESLNPISLAVTPNGEFLFVASASSNIVTMIDTATSASKSIDISCNTGTNNCNSVPPIAMTPITNAVTYAYVGTQNGFAIIDAGLGEWAGNVPTTCGRDPCAPLGIAASFDGATVFVSIFEINQVLGIDISLMNTVTDIAMVGTSPLGLAVTPNADAVYVANMNGQSVSAFNVASCGPLCSVTEISTGIINQPSVVAITPDGGDVYVGSDSATAISVIDTASNSVTATVQNVLSGAYAMVIGPGDSDEDGVPDALEGSRDTDNDGVRDSRDTDADGDTIPDAVEAGGDPANPVDTDGDGTPDYKDTDSDDDGIPDRVEAEQGDNDGCSIAPVTASHSAPLHLFMAVFLVVAARTAVRLRRKTNTRSKKP